MWTVIARRKANGDVCPMETNGVMLGLESTEAPGRSRQMSSAKARCNG
jgi:hypothetical protein